MLFQNQGSNIAGFTNAFAKERVRYNEVKEYATWISTALVKMFGLSSGQTVALFGPNSVWYPVAMFSTIRVGEYSFKPARVLNLVNNQFLCAGGIISGASPAYNVEEMTYSLKTGSAKFLMTTVFSLSVALPAAQNARIPPNHIFLLEGTADGLKTIQDLVAIGKGFGREGQVQSFKIPKGETNKDICGFLSFSSGTTGLPKAVSQTVAYLIELAWM